MQVVTDKIWISLFLGHTQTESTRKLAKSSKLGFVGKIKIITWEFVSYSDTFANVVKSLLNKNDDYI